MQKLTVILSITDSLVRKEAILLNMLHIRMLIKANVVILVDAIGTTDSALLQSFQRDLSVSRIFAAFAVPC